MGIGDWSSDVCSSYLPFAAPPFIIVMVTRHDMGRLAVREIADTIDVADPLRPVRAIECDPVVGAIMVRTLPHRPDKIFDGADNFVEPAECFHELDVPDGVVPPDVAEDRKSVV